MNEETIVRAASALGGHAAMLRDLLDAEMDGRKWVLVASATSYLCEKTSEDLQGCLDDDRTLGTEGFSSGLLQALSAMREAEQALTELSYLADRARNVEEGTDVPATLDRACDVAAGGAVSLDRAIADAKELLSAEGYEDV